MSRFTTLLFITTTLAAYTNCAKPGLEVNTDVYTEASEESPKEVEFSGIPSSKSAGNLDASCLSNTNYDACIFWKNPVAQNGNALTKYLNVGDNVDPLQTFGIQLEDLTSATNLKSTSLDIGVTSGQKLILNNGTYRASYSTDGNNHFLGQLMAYFWLTYQQKRIYNSTGIFYTKDQNIFVDAYNPSVQLNAYWDGEKIVMGYADNSTGTMKHEMAMSAEVYLHEMGHASLDYATGSVDGSGNLVTSLNMLSNAKVYYYCYTDNYVYASEPTTTVCPDDYAPILLCNSKEGCIAAIHEGQADFHHFMVFHENPNLFETMYNSFSGDSSAAVHRDPRRTQTWVTNDYYLKSKIVAYQKLSSSVQQITMYGEVHDMGSAYASILWNIYSDPGMFPADFEKIFMQHLQNLTSSSKFIDSRNALLAQDVALFGGKYQSLIRAAFSAKGVN